MATFNSLGSTVTSIDGRVTALENSPLPADISCTSLTASSFLETPELRGTPIVLRAIDNTLLASFAAAGITLDQDVTVNAARTLNATTADFAQLLAGSVAASGNVTTNGSILADQQIESDLRLRAPLLESDPAGFFLTLRGGTQGVLVDDLPGQRGHRTRGQLALPDLVRGHQRRAGAQPFAGADCRRAAGRQCGNGDPERGPHGREQRAPGLQ